MGHVDPYHCGRCAISRREGACISDIATGQVTRLTGNHKLATLIQASRLFARRHAPFGVAGNPEVGQLRLLERLDPDVAISVRPFARVWGAV
jgi:hypothetical protein